MGMKVPEMGTESFELQALRTKCAKLDQEVRSLRLFIDQLPPSIAQYCEACDDPKLTNELTLNGLCVGCVEFFVREDEDESNYIEARRLGEM